MSKAPVDVGDVDEEWEGFARRLKAARVAAGLSQAELATATGIAQGKISAIEGMTTNPSLVTVIRLAAGIGVPVHQLFADDAPN
ncbi:helix-turn-helix domain-containing protein [Rhizorhabdus argentea]|uniref:helix-turn-helix domain-containing protein n=1 Tax=Rhizorhabdus argentea TaxID=1387174 RepID=UPI0030ED9039